MSELQKAKAVSLEGMLSSLGYKPTRSTTKSSYYISPLRTENNPSFVVNKIKNTWVDHGSREHGDVIDFVCAYQGVSTIEAIRILNDNNMGLKPFEEPDQSDIKPNVVEVQSIGTINNPALLSYLEERCIDLDIANKHCVQVKWNFSDNRASSNFGIAFRNDSDGLEIRSQDFKIAKSPKTYRTIGEFTPTCNVFEGFFDYLSALTEHKTYHLKNQTYVLNGLAFVHFLIDKFQSYESVSVFLDNGVAANDKIRVMIDEGINVVDMRHIFEGSDDYNDYWVKKCKA